MCLAQLLSCTELHVSSSLYLVVVLLIDLCIRKKKEQNVIKLNYFSFSKKSQNIDCKKKVK